ncbi:M28 family metallopeptidase [Elusimicrobiota bacterium]
MTDISFNGKNAFSHLKHLAVKIGPRLTGSRGEHEAASYIGKHFKALGLKTRFQKYPCITYDLQKCVFEVRDNGRWRRIECQPVMLSTSTGSKGVEGPIYFAETGEKEYLSPDMKGKIVLVCGRVAATDFPRMLKYKPLALISIEPQVSEEPIRINFMDHNRKVFGNLPAGRIRHLDGLDIVKKGISRARFVLRTKEKKSHSINVVGEVSGRDFSDEITVVCSHYDSSMGISGASDNAGGTAVMMELARALSKAGTRRTLRFVAFSAEETGLYGSLHYARDLARLSAKEKAKKNFNKKIHKTQQDKHRLCFNLDVHGAVLGSNKVLYLGEGNVGSAVSLLAKETGMVVNVTKGPMSSDGTSLASLGIPAVQFARYGGTSGFLHSTRDDIRYLSASALEQAGRFSEMFLRRYVADSADLAFERKIPEDQMKKTREFFSELLRTTPPGSKEQKNKK